MEILKKWNEDQVKDEDEEEEKDKKKKEEKEAGDDEVAVVPEDKHDSDKENKDPKARGKKRKHSDDETSSDLEPPQKKRKISPKKKADKLDKKSKKSKKKKKKKDKKEEEIEAGPLNEVLGDMVDIMTGEALQTPAISPYGHVMEYNSWCSVLRNPKTKNKCPFTKQKMTRRSLVKLDADNIAEYKDKIVNITAEDMKCLNQ